MDIDSLTVGEAKRLAAMFSPACTPGAVATPQTEPVRQIVKVEGGWIFYGDVTTEGDTVHVRNGGTVRYYNEPDGGLNALASRKPSSKTRLDPAGHITFPKDRIRASVDIQEGGI